MPMLKAKWTLTATNSTHVCYTGLLGLKIFKRFRGLVVGMVMVVGQDWGDQYS